jgi:surface polysaccharide O-acyltransferase-like enzyme
MTNSRNRILDGAKLAAAASIVLLHVASSVRATTTDPFWPSFIVQMMNWSLYLFFAVSGYFHGSLGNSGRKWLRDRVLRLGVPYVFWSCVYLAWTAATRFATHQPFIPPDPVRVVLFAGARDVLWSLPMLVYLAVVTELAVKTAMARRVGIAAAIALMIAVYWLLPSAQWPQNSLVYFILAPRYLALYLIGMEVRSWPTQRPARVSTYYGLCLAGAAYMAAAAGGLLAIQNAVVSLTVFSFVNAAIAFALLRAGSLDLPLFGLQRLAWGGSYLLGVYVSHYLWLEVWTILTHRASIPDAVSILAGWCFCFGLAMLTVAVVRRIPYLRATVA